MISEIMVRQAWLWPLIWQSTTCLAAGLGGSFILRRRAARAHQVLLLALIAAAVIPILNGIVKRNQWGLVVAERTVPRVAVPAPAARISFPVPTPPPTNLPTDAATHAAEQLEGVTASVETRIEWMRIVLSLWLGAGALLLLRLILSFVRAVVLVGRSESAECRRITDVLMAVEKKLGIQTGMVVRSSHSIRSPIIWCWGPQPILLISSDACRDNERLDWTGIVCHELAHWRRRDHISRLFAEMLVCTLPWQPLLWWAHRRLMNLSEQACDDWVIASGQRTTSYARTLLGLTPQGQAAILPAVVTTRTGLAARVRRILEEKGGSPHAGLRWSLTAGILTACIALGIAFAQTRPRAEDPQMEIIDSATAPDVTPVMDSSDDWPIPSRVVRLRLRDPTGLPVAGATVGSSLRVLDETSGTRLRWLGEQRASDEHGGVFLHIEDTLNQGPEKKGAVYVLHGERMLGAMQAFSPADAGGTIDVVLQPVCCVQGTLRCPGLPATTPLRSTGASVE